uniref:Glucose dehydrogenase [FAD, quinone] n=1 Tax=Cacopsylla melanoneura TaxID=428564 RepID=A0A8D8QZP3_9HEMI
MPQISCANLDTHGSVVATLFTHFLTSILTKQCEFGNVAYPPDRTNDVLDNHVKIDMIVVGSGSSGSVVANRLSEVAKWNVLLIEAGDDPSVSSYIPALTFALQKTSIDWAYKTEKQPGVCEGLENGVCNMPRGKALGGSSNMNFMMYLVGNPNDYNSWGSSDWNFKNVEKYFHKSFAEYYFAGHANDPIAYNKTELWDMILNAGKELNIHKLMYKNKNINPNKVGTLHLKTNIKDGERLNTAKAFLAPIKDRPNLFVMKNTLVTKILLDNKKATGVQVYKDEKYYEIKFTKELIISAGAVNTPQLLFQSGIGDEQLLKNENIDVKVNLPSVGKYLYDHPLFVVPVEMTPLETKKKRKSENKDETESSEEKKPERKHHRKQHGNEFIFGEEPNNNDKKNNAGGGRKSNKNHKHHKAAEGTLLGERKDPDNNEEGLTSAEERGVKTTDIPPFNIPTLNFKPVVFEEEPEVPQMPNINERLPTTITPELSTSPTTTTTTTTTSTSTARTMPDDDDDDDMDDVNYDEGYEADNEEQDRYRRRRSPRHKNKKNKNKENKTEHPETKTVPTEPMKDFPPSAEIYKYIMERSGPLAGIGTGDYVTFVDTTGKSPNNPNLMLMYCFYPKNDKSGMHTLLHAYNWNSNMIDALTTKQNDILLIIPVLLKPISYGNVTLSKNVLDRPKIYLNYFNEKEDLNTFVKGVRFVEKFIETKSFKKHNAKMMTVPDRGCDQFEPNSDDYWKCTFKRRATSCYHLSSTARMGDNMLSSVVNYKLQVHGVENVRVADASVMPYTVNANIHATCVMIGEKAADLVKQDWKEKT